MYQICFTGFLLNRNFKMNYIKLNFISIIILGILKLTNKSNFRVNIHKFELITNYIRCLLYFKMMTFHKWKCNNQSFHKTKILSEHYLTLVEYKHKYFTNWGNSFINNKRRTLPMIKFVLIMKRAMEDINYHCGFTFINIMVLDYNTYTYCFYLKVCNWNKLQTI